MEKECECYEEEVQSYRKTDYIYSASKLELSSHNLQYITNKHLFNRNVKANLWEKLLAVDQDDYIYF